jgi:thiol-disulfide isomerase/thioredoxin
MIFKIALFIVFILISGTCNLTQAQEPDLSDLMDFEIQSIGKADKLKTIKLSKLIGKQKVIVIDLWATWCGPCRQSIPELVSLQTEYKDKGVEIIGLSIETPDKLKSVLEMRSSFKINYQLGFTTPELYSAMDNRRVVPQTFIFGRDGVLIKHIRGWSQTLVPKVMRESIEIALNQKQ